MKTRNLHESLVTAERERLIKLKDIFNRYLGPISTKHTQNIQSLFDKLSEEKEIDGAAEIILGAIIFERIQVRAEFKKINFYHKDSSLAHFMNVIIVEFKDYLEKKGLHPQLLTEKYLLQRYHDYLLKHSKKNKQQA